MAGYKNGQILIANLQDILRKSKFYVSFNHWRNSSLIIVDVSSIFEGFSTVTRKDIFVV